jgi:DnaK suppressor protein
MAVKTATKKVAKPTVKAAAHGADTTRSAPVAAVQQVAEAEPAEAPTRQQPSPDSMSGKGPARIMSEAEILAAPEKDYMNSSQLLFFRTRLHDMEQDILRNAGETTEHLRESIIVPDPADRATIEEEHALELRTRDRERKLLKKIQQSIQRIDSGEYGYCEETGDPIGVPRLLARPTATLSLEAQERREMKQKMFGE